MIFLCPKRHLWLLFCDESSLPPTPTILLLYFHAYIISIYIYLNRHVHWTQPSIHLYIACPHHHQIPFFLRSFLIFAHVSGLTTTCQTKAVRYLCAACPICVLHPSNKITKFYTLTCRCRFMGLPSNPIREGMQLIGYSWSSLREWSHAA